MEKFLKDLLEQATKDGKVHVIKVEHGEDVQGVPEPDDIYAEVKQEAEHIAKVNKILFDAHVAAGFDIRHQQNVCLIFQTGHRLCLRLRRNVRQSPC